MQTPLFFTLSCQERKVKVIQRNIAAFASLREIAFLSYTPSYRQRDVDAIFKYIQNLKEHHKTQAFRDEYLDFLKEFNVAYDEQYIFQGVV